MTETEIMSKFIVFAFFAIALSGCCVSGTSCYAPVTGSQSRWDGLEEPQQDDTLKKTPRPKKEMATAAQTKGDARVVSRPLTKEEWEQQAAADRADEARLTKKLKICNGCSNASEKANDATAGEYP
jgi:hypothetical protein